MLKGIGLCAVCGRGIQEMTEIRTVLRGVPKRAYLSHKSCVPDESKPEQPVVVSDPTEFARSQLKTTEAKESAPSMPVKEQTGRRRSKKEITDEPTTTG